MKMRIVVLILLSLPLTVLSQPMYQIQFSGFIGGSGYEQVRDITTDCQGNIYVTGGTSSLDFPVTNGSYLKKGKYTMDVFVMKFSSEGKLIWSTLFGGPEYDRAYAIEVDSAGAVYIAGRAGHSLPTTECSFQMWFGGDEDPNPLYGEQDGFIAKFSPNGEPDWCSYFGAADRGFIRDLALDASGNIYIVETESKLQNPYVGPNAIQSQHGGGYDGVVAKISGDGREVIWGTYLGGAKDDLLGPSIRINSRNEVVVAGTVFSNNMPVTVGCLDSTFNGESDIYYAVISGNGNKLISASYLGGNQSEGTETHNLWLTHTDEILIAATTSSENFPTTEKTYSKKFSGNGKVGSGLNTNYPADGFITKLSADGKKILASTYLGGSKGEGIEGIGVNKGDTVFVSGATFSDKFLSKGSKEAYKGNKGEGDVFVAALLPDLSDVIYFNYLGEAKKDYGRSLYADDNGRIFLCGETSSAKFPVKNFAYQKYGDGGQDGFISVLQSGKYHPEKQACKLKEFKPMKCRWINR